MRRSGGWEAVSTLAAIALRSVSANSVFNERARTTHQVTPLVPSKGVSRMALKDVGALWNGKPGSKVKYSGQVEIGGKVTRLMVFANQHKKAGDKKPDLRIVTEVAEEDEVQAPPVTDEDVVF